MNKINIGGDPNDKSYRYKMPSSFLKWVGGKQQIINEIYYLLPSEINTYYEPFIGGGSVLLFLLDKCDEKELIINKFIIGDINTDLINLYLTIKNQPQQLITMINKLHKRITGS